MNLKLAFIQGSDSRAVGNSILPLSRLCVVMIHPPGYMGNLRSRPGWGEDIAGSEEHTYEAIA